MVTHLIYKAIKTVVGLCKKTEVILDIRDYEISCGYETTKVTKKGSTQRTGDGACP